MGVGKSPNIAHLASSRGQVISAGVQCKLTALFSNLQSAIYRPLSGPQNANFMQRIIRLRGVERVSEIQRVTCDLRRHPLVTLLTVRGV